MSSDSFKKQDAQGHFLFAGIVRKLINISVRVSSSNEQWQKLVRSIVDATEKFEQHPDTTLYDRGPKVDPLHGFGSMSTVCGAFNPIAPPMHVRIEPDLIIGEVQYGAAYEGAPGCLHGGHIALAFDHVAGRVASAIGPVLTGKLSVRYLKPTRLDRNIRFEARIREKHNRVITVDCDAYDNEVKTASAEVVFMLMSRDRIMEILEIRAASDTTKNR